MFTKRTIIGTIVGGAIIAIGVYSLIMSLGLQSIDVNETFGIGEFTSYSFEAPAHSVQYFEISGDTYDVEITTPEGGLQIPLTPHRNEVSFEWVHLIDGRSLVKIQNTGQTEFNVTGTFQVMTDPIFITYHFMVIIAGVIIIGFSAGFSVRKPRGF